MTAVIVNRIAQPLSRSARHQLRVVKIIEEAPGVVSVVVKGRDVHRLGAQRHADHRQGTGRCELGD